MRHFSCAVLTLAFLLCPTMVMGDTTSTEVRTASPTPAPEPAPLFQMHYKNRVRSFEEQNLLLQNVVLLGDSITEGFELPKYMAGRRMLNRGVGGDVIGNNLPSNDARGVLKRLDASVFDCSPTHLFILIGINDLGQGHSPEVLEAGYREMLTKIRARLPELKIYVQSVLPCRDKFAKHNANVVDVNRRIQALATEFKCVYIDLHSQFIDSTGQLKDEMTNDGLHLTAEGYKVWSEVIAKEMGWQ